MATIAHTQPTCLSVISVPQDVSDLPKVEKCVNWVMFQNSKYSSSKGSYGGGGERYERIRDSPNGNSYRSDSPDSASPRERLGPDRSYQSKSSYLQKIREKERETRDYKLGREASRGGVYASSECRSPKDKRSKDSEHRTNHDRERERDRGSMEEKLALHPSGLKHSSSSSGSQRSAQQDRKPLHNSCQDKVS